MLAAMLADRASAELEEDVEDGPVQIFAENADACRLFFGMGTQWRAVAVAVGPFGMIVKTALDYAALPVVAGALKIDLSGPLLDQLQTLETEAAAAMADRQVTS